MDEKMVFNREKKIAVKNPRTTKQKESAVLKNK